MTLRVIWNGRSAMNAEQQKLDSISNNIANVNTTGYKGEDVSFQDLVYESVKRTGYPTNDSKNNILNGTGVKAGAWIRDTTQGTLKETDVKTDFAIDGDGYFRVTLTDGSKAYERAGSFNLDNSGTLVDKNGNKIDIDVTDQGQNADGSPVVLTNNNFTVKENGEIYVDNKADSVYYGKMNIYNPISQDSLSSIGQNLYVLKQGGQMNVSNNVSIRQGFVEQSNVDIGKELTDMIVAQRAFGMGSKALQTGDEMWSMINNLKGK
ncbi:flagellar hook-basal body complex protein [Clostridium thailandense]|uniref:Flagellar basal body rod protein FlgG n=1 Tax=Clostridium thailandense TaxID=2794346 RepID=A0A949TTQ7_9CLOT|nr:flagellar hook-basal body complex protein [Clostridium thailandense]MBV7272198.1 flagellar basal body rod protein FlgG [Clostridium thailandense]MCH5136517.1 flagellar basal body rod protein FlgG [Clostridiaceae bacterium UIB06]